MGNGRYTKEGKKRAERIRKILSGQEYGMTHGQLLEELGLNPRGRMDSSLAALDKHRLMLSEDDKGRLWLFEERGLYSVGEWDRWR